MNYLLGLGHEHDSGIALLGEDGLVFAANEERFNRQKFTKELPHEALRSLLAITRVVPSAITEIAVGSCMHSPTVVETWTRVQIHFRILYELLHFLRLDRLIFGTVAGAQIVAAVVALLTNPLRRIKIKKMLRAQGIAGPIRWCDHHLVHALTALFGSGFERCLVITLDAQGDGLCSRIYTVNGESIACVNRVPFFHSPGNYYAYITYQFGFKMGREGKVTGLAAYGDPEKTAPIFRSRMQLDRKRLQFINKGYYRGAEMRYLKHVLKDYAREDIAAGVQRVLEEVVTGYVREAVLRFSGGRAKVALAGGVFANVKLNQRIRELPEIEDVFIFPHMGDGGMAAGAAMARATAYGWRRPGPMPHAYLGPDYSAEDITSAMREAGVHGERPSNLADAVAALLAQGKVVAVYGGRMEYGPRALGNRSILSQATDPKVNDWLNARLKRSEFMPFAPILKHEHLSEYFTGYEKCMKALEFMTITLDANERCKREAPAIVHVDGTARPQIVMQDVNPFIYDILGEYERKSGLRVLINTSFNMHEEPIVCTPHDAIRAFLQGGLDALAIGPYLITQKKPI